MEGIGLFAEAARLQKNVVPHELGNVSFKNIFSREPWKYPLSGLENFVVYKRHPESTVSIEVKMDLPDSEKQKLLNVFEASKTIDFIDRFSSEGYEINFRFSDDFFSQTVKFDDNPMLKICKEGRSVTAINLDKSKMQFGPGSPEIYPEVLFYARNFSNNRINYPGAELMINSLRRRFERIYLISGERGRIDAQLGLPNLGQRMPNQLGMPSWVGYKGENVIEVLSRCFTREQKVAKKIQEWAEKFQIPELRAGYVGEGKLETNFVDPQYDTSLNAALAGLGSRQILPIIVQIFAAEPGSVIMVEEPEISVHPESQVLLDELFATAISEGKQIICTTHSPFLILAINRIIKKGLAKVDSIAIYHVEKGEEGTKATQLPLNKHGFLENGIPSFMKTEQQLFNEWSETLEEE